MRQRKMRQPKMHVRRNRLAAGERMMSWRNTDCPMDARETGLKPPNGFRLKGLLIYSPRRPIGKSG